MKKTLRNILMPHYPTHCQLRFMILWYGLAKTAFFFLQKLLLITRGLFEGPDLH